jgi:hypothetical protein
MSQFVVRFAHRLQVIRVMCVIKGPPLCVVQLINRLFASRIGTLVAIPRGHMTTNFGGYVPGVGLDWFGFGCRFLLFNLV